MGRRRGRHTPPASPPLPNPPLAQAPHPRGAQCAPRPAKTNPSAGVPRGTAARCRRLPPTERRAVEILEAQDNWSKADVRKAYKALIKVLHPDMNGGDRSQEEQLQEVVWAWDQIKDSRNFK